MRRPDADLEEKREPRVASSAGARKGASMKSSGRSLTLAAIEKGPSPGRALTGKMRRKRTSTTLRPAFRNRPTADLAQMDCGGHGAHGAEHHSFTGVTMGAPLPFSNTTTNLAGSMLLALRPTT